MIGPYKLNHFTINNRVKEISPGSYILGRVVKWGDKSFFIPKYVGRAHGHLNERLKDHSGFTHFKFRYETSPQSAFYSECTYYHKHKSSLINRSHPKPPKGTGWRCPKCKVSG